MTIDRIRIETKEQADAVKAADRLILGSNRSTMAAALIGDTLTHVAITVAQAIEARRRLLGWCCACDYPGEPCENGCHDLRRIADLILPPPLAEAAELQAVAPGLIDGLQHLVNEYGLAGVHKVLDEHGSRFAQGDER